MDKECSVKGTSSLILATIIGIFFIVSSIIIGISAWERVAYTECWQDASEQFDNLCLGGGVFQCTSPAVSSEIKHTIKLGSCVEAVYIVDREHIANALLIAGCGDTAECEWSLKSFIVLIPRKTSDAAEAIKNPVEFARKKASGIICKGYNTVLQGTNIMLKGPKTEPFVEYCLIVRRLPGTSGEDYVFRINASVSACDNVK